MNISECIVNPLLGLHSMRKIGFRRLYQSHGWEDPSEPSRTTTMKIGGVFTVEIHLGIDTLYPIVERNFPEESFYGESFQAQFTEVKQNQIGGKKKGYAEVIVWKDTDAMFDDSLLANEKAYLDELIKHNDMHSAILGILTNNQVIFDILTECLIAIDDSQEIIKYYFNVNLHHKYEIDIIAFEDNLSKMSFNSDSRISVAAGWLIRAWSERNIHLKFLALFVPIEIVLQGYGFDSPAHNSPSEEIKRLIATHAGNNAKMLNDWLHNLTKPSLNQRFANMAKLSSCPNHEQDIKDFQKINTVRNKLLHQGYYLHSDKDIEAVSFPEKQLIEYVSRLQFLASRYVAYALTNGSVTVNMPRSINPSGTTVVDHGSVTISTAIKRMRSRNPR